MSNPTPTSDLFAQLVDELTTRPDVEVKVGCERARQSLWGGTGRPG
jgi:hypothetical protein